MHLPGGSLWDSNASTWALISLFSNTLLFVSINRPQSELLSLPVNGLQTVSSHPLLPPQHLPPLDGWCSIKTCTLLLPTKESFLLLLSLPLSLFMCLSYEESIQVLLVYSFPNVISPSTHRWTNSITTCAPKMHFSFILALSMVVKYFLQRGGVDFKLHRHQ